MTPDEALRRIAFLLEWRGASPYRVRAFHTAAGALRDLSPGPVDAARAARLRGVGPVTAEVISQASTGAVPDYLAHLQAEADGAARAGWDLAAASTGDCHLHSDWSDGGSPLEDMAETDRPGSGPADHDLVAGAAADRHGRPTVNRLRGARFQRYAHLSAGRTGTRSRKCGRVEEMDRRGSVA
ncbi:hypothetical protein [Streptomyces zaomyceticus]|uniref:hypothetical protein n=1 Tax=Streptomyces zaomyceticus TaxID=68286 RepID=UPI00341E6733